MQLARSAGVWLRVRCECSRIGNVTTAVGVELRLQNGGLR